MPQKEEMTVEKKASNIVVRQGKATELPDCPSAVYRIPEQQLQVPAALHITVQGTNSQSTLSLRVDSRIW